jgi:calcineurin-like phosphoesterase family protein
MEEEDMIYFTSDLHFGHEAVIAMGKRPFSNVEEMNEKLIENWNKVVHDNDDIYILGDLFYRTEQPIEGILQRLSGRKHLVFGNHDKWWKNKVDLGKYFVEWGGYMLANTGNGNATLCHFPQLHGEGKYLIHGHLHNRRTEWYWEFYKGFDRALNAGVDVNDYRPVNLTQLIENNRRFKGEIEV